MNKKILAAFLCVCMVVVTGSFPVSAAKTKKTYKIAIDAGHQGKGNGKTEPIGPGAKMRKPKVAYGTHDLSQHAGGGRSAGVERYGHDA